MEKNALKQITITWWYFFRHPLQAIGDIFYNLRAAYYRVVRGWTFIDAVNLDDWLLTMLPAMLEELADGMGYPESEKFPTEKEWHDWLRQQAANLRRCDDDGIKNEYEEEFDEACKKYKTVTVEEDGTHVYSMEDCEEFKEIKERYWARFTEINEEKQRLIEQTFAALSKHFFALWD